MANKKIIYVLVAAVFIGIVGFFILKIYFLDGVSNENVTGQSSTEPGTVIISQLVNIPTGDIISIGTASGAVIVKNFYKVAIGGAEQFIVIKKNESYEINYDTYTSGFSIYISASPFTMNRQAAENDFLGTLGISQGDACKLKVFESAAPGIEADESLRGLTPHLGTLSVGLSFCGGIL